MWTIRISVLYVKEIYAANSEVRCRFLSLGVNGVYSGSKSCILIEVTDLWATGSYTQQNSFLLRIEEKNVDQISEFRGQYT